MSSKHAVIIGSILERLEKGIFSGKVTFEVNFLTGGVTRLEYAVKQDLTKGGMPEFFNY